MILLLLHIAVAFAGLAVATLGFFTPSKQKLATTYGLAAGTLASGTVLLMLKPSHLVQACVSGLVYFSVVLYLASLTRRRLSAAQARI